MALSALQFLMRGNRNPGRAGRFRFGRARRTSHVAATATMARAAKGLDFSGHREKLETECAPGLKRIEQRIHAVPVM